MKYEYWISGIAGIRGDKKIIAASHFSSAEGFYRQGLKAWKSLKLFTEKELALLEKHRKEKVPEEEWDKFLKTGIRFLTFHNSEYPERLQNIVQKPYAIFVKGSLPDECRTVGIIGARRCSEYGRNFASMLGERLAKENIAVISGLAEA